MPGLEISSDLERLLGRCERAIGLLVRCQPLNLAEEGARLTADLNAGRSCRPNWRYPKGPCLNDVIRILEQASSSLPAGGMADLFRARIAELVLEACLADAVGGREFAYYAQRRYVRGQAAEKDAALQLCHTWLAECPEATIEHLVATDDEADPASLICQLRARLGQERLPFRVEISNHLTALAATGANVIWVAAGRELSRAATERVVVHEVLGHARPRARAAAQSNALFRVGSAGGNDEQEGLALHYESEANQLGPRRRRELALRHLVAVAMFDGAEFHQSLLLATANGAQVPQAIAVVSRIYRGGGLGREYTYIPALLRVKTAVQEAPWLLAWLACGRVSVSALRKLGDIGALTEPVRLS